jgi:4-aminobutyrate aminotransferase
MQLDDMCLWQLELMFRQQTAPSETAALLIEPVLGEGGYVPATAYFLQNAHRMCRERNVLLICDEIQSGYGRTGRMFASQLVDVVPDVLIMAKVCDGVRDCV